MLLVLKLGRQIHCENLLSLKTAGMPILAVTVLTCRWPDLCTKSTVDILLHVRLLVLPYLSVKLTIYFVMVDKTNTSNRKTPCRQRFPQQSWRYNTWDVFPAQGSVMSAWRDWKDEKLTLTCGTGNAHAAVHRILSLHRRAD